MGSSLEGQFAARRGGNLKAACRALMSLGSFNGRIRDELLNERLFFCVPFIFCL